MFIPKETQLLKYCNEYIFLTNWEALLHLLHRGSIFPEAETPQVNKMYRCNRHHQRVSVIDNSWAAGNHQGV